MYIQIYKSYKSSISYITHIYTHAYICQIVAGYWLLHISERIKILWEFTMIARINSYIVMYPFDRTFQQKWVKSKVRGNMIVLISHFDIRIMLAPTNKKWAILSSSHIFKGSILLSLFNQSQEIERYTVQLNPHCFITTTFNY